MKTSGRFGYPVVSLCLLAILTGCARSPQATRDRSLVAGRKFMQARDFRRALLEFKNAVQAMPRDAESQYQLGNASAATGDLAGAAAAYRRAAEINPHHQEAQNRLAQIMAVLGDRAMVEDAEKRLRALLDVAPADMSALNTLAFAELKLGDHDDAIRHLQEVLSQSPKQLGSAVLLAQARLEQKDAAGAEAALKRACEQNPSSPDAFAVMGRFYTTLGRTAEAEQQFERALAVAPKHGPALFYLAMLENTQGGKQEAEAHFKLLSTHPEKTYWPLYGMFLFEQGRSAEAVSEFERLYRGDPNDPAAQTRLIGIYRAVNRTADAEKLVNTVLARNPKDWRALLERSTLRLARGNYADAQGDLNQVLHENPAMAQAHYVQARIHEKNGARLSQRQELNEALRLDPLFLPARVALARLLTQMNAAKTALEVLEETPAPQKASLALVVERNWALAGQGNLAAMQKGVEQGLRQQRLPDLLIQDAFLKLGKRNFEGAKNAAEEALRASPGEIRGLELLARSYAGHDQAAAALAKLEDYAAQQPQSASVQFFLGQWLLEQGDRNRAREAFYAAKKAGFDTTDVGLSLAQVDLLDAKWQDARQQIVEILRANNGNITAHYWLAQVEEIQGHRQESIEQYRKVIAADPGNTAALNNLAFLLAQTGAPGEALPLAQHAKELAPANAAVADTLGWILYQNGLYSLAVKQLEEANRLESTARRVSHLSMAYLKVGTPAKARAMLQQALKLDPKVPEVRQAQELMAGSADLSN